MTSAQLKQRFLDTLITAGNNVIVVVDTYPHPLLKLPIDWLLETNSLIDDRFAAFEIEEDWLPDLEINEETWSCTLLFDGKDFRCVIPWDNVRQFEAEDCFVVWKTPEVPENPTEKPKTKTLPPYLRIVK
jgi:hypothetical protein